MLQLKSTDTQTGRCNSQTRLSPNALCKCEFNRMGWKPNSVSSSGERSYNKWSNIGPYLRIAEYALCIWLQCFHVFHPRKAWCRASETCILGEEVRQHATTHCWRLTGTCSRSRRDVCDVTLFSVSLNIRAHIAMEMWSRYFAVAFRQVDVRRKYHIPSHTEFVFPEKLWQAEQRRQIGRRKVNNLGWHCQVPVQKV